MVTGLNRYPYCLKLRAWQIVLLLFLPRSLKPKVICASGQPLLAPAFGGTAACGNAGSVIQLCFCAGAQTRSFFCERTHTHCSRIHRLNPGCLKGCICWPLFPVRTHMA
jgi:hypothetical protein